MCSSCIFDLAFGDPTVRPDIEAGISAVREALDNTPTTLEQGNVGAGTGATVGKLMGPATCMKAGLGAVSYTHLFGPYWPNVSAPLRMGRCLLTALVISKNHSQFHLAPERSAKCDERYIA